MFFGGAGAFSAYKRERERERERELREFMRGDKGAIVGKGGERERGKGKLLEQKRF